MYLALSPIKWPMSDFFEQTLNLWLVAAFGQCYQASAGHFMYKSFGPLFMHWFLRRSFVCLLDCLAFLLRYP